MATEQELALLVKVKDQASKALAGIRGKMGALGGAARTALKAGMFAGAAAVTGAGIAAVKSSLDFKSAFDTIKTGTGAAGPALAGLQESAKKVFGSIPVDIGPAAKAIADFNTLTGLSGEPLEHLTRQALEAGRMLGEDVTGLVENAAKAFNVFGGANEDAGEDMNRFFVASQATGVPMTQLLGLVKTFGPVLKNAGFGLTDTTALFGSLQKAGIDVTRVMPGLNAFTRKLAEEGVTDLKGALFDTVEQIKNAKTDTEALALATKAFGAEGAQRMSVAIRTGAVDIKGLSDQMRNGVDAIQKNAAATDDFNERLHVVKNNALLAAKPLGDLVLKGLNKLSLWLQAHQEEINAFIRGFEAFVQSKAIPTITRAFERLQDIWVAIEPTVKKVVKFFQENKLAAIALGVAIGALVVVLGGPVTALIAIVTAGTLILANWDAIKKAALDLVAKVKGGFNDLIAKVKDIPVLGAIFTATFDLIRNRVETVMKAIQAVVRIVMALIKGDWGAAWHGIKDLVTVLIRGVLTEITTVLNLVKQVFLDILPALVALAGLAWDGIKAGAAAAWDGIKALLAAAWDGIKDLAVTAFNAILGVITRALNEVVGFFTALPGRIVAALANFGLLLVGLGQNLVAGLFNGIKGWWAREVAFWTGLGRRIVGAIGAAGTFLVHIGQNLVAGLFNGVKAIWDREVAGFRNIKAKVTGAIGDLGATLWRTGYDLIAGFFEGIKAKWSSLTGWIGDKISDLKDSFTSGFGLFSPSRVFRTYGAGIVRGLVEGLGSDADTIDRALAAMMGKVKSAGLALEIPAGAATTAAPALATAAVAPGIITAGAGAGRPIHVTVELDGRVIADTVMKHAARDVRLRTGRRNL